MCLLCVEIMKEKMSAQETRRALGELINTTDENHLRDHYLELMRATNDEEELKRLASEGAQN